MPNNVIKVGTANDGLSIQRGPFAVGATGVGDYGPTSRTGYYAAIDVPAGARVFYQADAYGNVTAQVANDDAQALYFLKSYGATGTTLEEALVWSNSQPGLANFTEDISSATVNAANGTSGTSGSGGTMWSINYADTQQNTCSGNGSTGTIYTANNVSIGNGVTVYTDSQLTSPYNLPIGSNYVKIGNSVFGVYNNLGTSTLINESSCGTSGSGGTSGTSGSSGGGNVPTAFLTLYYINEYNSCNSTADGQFVVYSLSNTLSAGSTVFTNAGLTTSVRTGYVIASIQMNSTKYLVGAGGVLSAVDCGTVVTAPLNATNYFSAGDACQGINSESTTLVYPNYTSLGNGTSLFLDAELTQPYQPGNAGWVSFVGIPGIVYNTEFNNGNRVIFTNNQC
jgi:hypothetical protein